MAWSFSLLFKLEYLSSPLSYPSPFLPHPFNPDFSLSLQCISSLSSPSQSYHGSNEHIRLSHLNCLHSPPANFAPSPHHLRISIQIHLLQLFLKYLEKDGVKIVILSNPVIFVLNFCLFVAYSHAKLTVYKNYQHLG